MAGWSSTYSAQWRMSRVDASSWERCADIPGVISMRVERDCSGEELESAQVEVELGALDSFAEGWYRLGVAAEAGYEDVATLWFAAESREWDRDSSTATLYGRSALYPASARALRPGAFAAAGDDGAAWAARMLAGCTPAPVSASGSFQVPEDYVFDVGSSVLSAVWKVVGAAGWCIRISARGEVEVAEKPSEVALSLDRGLRSSLMPGSSCRSRVVPNALVAIDGDEVAEAVDDDPASGSSVASRGFRVEVVDASPSPRGGETLQSYAARRLAEEAAGAREYTYAREHVPGVGLFDLVAGTLPRMGLSGLMRVAAQSVECDRGVTVEETVRLEEVL